MVEYWPAAQLEQLDNAAAPVVPRKVPTGQPMHAEFPLVLVYRPTAQLVHTTAPAPEYAPAVQLLQNVDEAIPVVPEKKPAGHEKHVDDNEAPGVVE
jgi:hypothetical protein